MDKQALQSLRQRVEDLNKQIAQMKACRKNLNQMVLQVENQALEAEIREEQIGRLNSKLDEVTSTLESLYRQHTAAKERADEAQVQMLLQEVDGQISQARQHMGYSNS